MSHTIEVPIRYEKHYPICIGENMWQQIERFCSDRYAQRLALSVIDERVQQLHGQRIANGLSRYFDRVETYVVPEGEQSKSTGPWQQIIDFIMATEVERQTPLFAIGGGVTGDLAGFAASAALRGIPLVHLPTSLLAMVDSSIGGKTGINHKTGKNLVGAFYQPDAVFADLEFLHTLAREEWINGLSEILKYGAIRSPEIFDLAAYLIENEGFAPSDNWAELIARSAAIKVDVVQADTLESGKRAYLNFGHTFGHALEKMAGYGKISHGQAVFIGMIAAVHASKERGARIDSARFDPFKSLYPLVLHKYAPEVDELVVAMRSDKKVHNDQIRLILLENWGRPYIHTCDDGKLIENAWSFAYKKFR
ncbi:MAG: 3-dehydroquinate synthase [Balneolaceae bacterium]|nr:3-dehydroquinate synthase [Balneolaceae bacterium]